MGLFRIKWQNKVSDSGIQIANGPTTVEKFGTVLSVVPVSSSPGQLSFLFLVNPDDTDGFAVVDIASAKAVHDEEKTK